MAANPNPALITAALWRMWETCLTFIPGLRLGGIYAFKPGYHSTVQNNLANWPGNYSIRLQLDLTGDLTKARAIDLTMSTAEMTKRTGYLKAAALHPDDDRLGCMREFYGTLDGTTVYGLIHDSPASAWRSSTSDTSHLWHIHGSGFTEFCDDWAAAPGVYGWEGVASVLSGETWESWVNRKTGTPPSTNVEDEDMRLVQISGSTTLYCTDGFQYRPLTFAAWQAQIRMWGNMPIEMFGNQAELEAACGWLADGSDHEPWTPEQLALVTAAAKEGAAAGVVAAAPIIADEVADEIHADPERDGRDT